MPIVDRIHKVGKRLARGLLLDHDHAQTDQLPLTHQLLADMLGVQQRAVTIAAIKLHQEGVIRYSRGKTPSSIERVLRRHPAVAMAINIENYESLLS